LRKGVRNVSTLRGVHLLEVLVESWPALAPLAVALGVAKEKPKPAHRMENRGGRSSRPAQPRVPSSQVGLRSGGLNRGHHSPVQAARKQVGGSCQCALLPPGCEQTGQVGHFTTCKPWIVPHQTRLPQGPQQKCPQSGVTCSASTPDADL